MIRIDRRWIPNPGASDSKGFENFIKNLLKEHKYKKHATYFDRLCKGLKSFYNNKCGYCETRVSEAGSFLDIDHYRPKGELKGDPSHPGYYWLGYEWTNLVPACPRCNRHKSGYFPISGKRVTKPPKKNGQLDWDACRVDSKIHRRENPLLLHPGDDTPENHLVFTPDGKINGVSPKGKTTVRICKLNRGPLVLERLKLIDKVYKDIFTTLHTFIKKKSRGGLKTLGHDLDKIFSKIKRMGEPQRSYSRLGWLLFDKFEIFFIKRLQEDLGEKSARIVKKAFESFRESGASRGNGADM